MLRHLSLPSKGIRDNSVTHVAQRECQLSVTETENVTHTTRLLPAKRCAALQPWLDFARAALPLVRDVPFRRPQRGRQTVKALAALREFVERAPETDSFPAQVLRGLLKPSLESGLDADAGAKIIADLADHVIGILDYCADKPLSPVLPPSYRVAAQGHTLIRVEAGRVARDAFGDPLEPFLQALEGTETSRIGRCPICDRFFFAIRTDRRAKRAQSEVRNAADSSTKACSRACGTALRVRKHRQRDDERISRTAAMLRAGKGIKEIAEIARALEVTQIQARRYVRKARERERKGA